MPKQFYTERDIEQLVSSGTHQLTLNDNVVLTEQAYEAARRLGLALLQDRPSAPPSAPVRPYLSKIPADKPAAPAQPPAPQAAASYAAPTPPPAAPEMTRPAAPEVAHSAAPTAERIRAAVIARLGDSIDPALLNTIIHRVLESTGVK
jgi:hypothetical protein